MLVVALIVAVAALAVGVVAVTKKTPKVQLAPVTSATASLHREAVAQFKEITELKAEVAKLKAESTRIASSLHTVGICLPELSGQINGLSVETSYVELGERTFLTNAYLKTGKQVSSYCTKTLEGH